MVDLASALAALSGALTAARQLIEIDRSWEQANFKLEIATITDALARAQIALAEAKEEISSKDQEIRKLIDTFQVMKETVENKGFYYTSRNDGEPQGFPFCPVCLMKGEMILVTDLHKPMRILTCPKCKADIAAPYYRYE